MAERRTTIDGLADAIMDGLKEYADLATDTVKDAVKDVSVQEVPDLYLCIQYRTTEVCSARFPHSEICGSLNICFLPQLIAAYHVFHRLSVPRHPPCALLRLTCHTMHSVAPYGSGFF